MKSAGHFFREVIAFLVRHEWIVLCLFLVFVLRLPTLFEPNWYGDEEIYFVMGQGLRKGLVFYRDIFDHKPPLIYVMAAIAQSVFWFRLILMFVHAISVIYFARLAELLLHKKWAVILSTGIYALLSTLPTIEGTIANGENFMTVPALIALFLFYTLIKESSEKKFSWLWIGFWFAIAFLIKVPIIFDFIAMGLFWWWFVPENISLKKLVSRLFSAQIGFMLLGFLIPIIFSVLYYASVGAFEPYVRSALLQNIGYIQSWRDSGADASILANPLVWRLLVILVFLLVAGKIKNHTTTSHPILFLGIWFLFSAYGALLSNRPYPHYLLQPLIPAVLLVIALIEEYFLRPRREVFLGLLSLGIGSIFLLEVGFGHYPTVSYYKNFADYALGKKDSSAYENFFPAPLSRNKKVALYLRERTLPQEKVFVWGEEPAIYNLADRLPVGRYIVSFHIRDFPAGFDETYTALLDQKPNYIVVIPHQVPSFPRLETLLMTDYVHVTTIDDALIYKKIEPKLVLNVR